MDVTRWLEITQVSLPTTRTEDPVLIVFEDEGPSFVPRNITSEDAFVKWVRDTLPEFGDNDIAKILRYYPSSNTTGSSNGDKFATSGISGPSALSQSSIATGQQQRANVGGIIGNVCESSAKVYTEPLC